MLQCVLLPRRTARSPTGVLSPANGRDNIGASYPEGNFGWNQLLDGSISLSPLYPAQTIDLHVRIAADLHQGFP